MNNRDGFGVQWIEMNQLSLADLRQNAGRVLRRAGSNGEPCVILSRTKPVAVVLSPGAYEEMRSRLAELERAEIVQDVRQGMKEYRAGKSKKLRSLKDLR
jgi:prevent-host-death family protein